jgi:uncharacterized repeat protein (TIGR03803 family)
MTNLRISRLFPRLHQAGGKGCNCRQVGVSKSCIVLLFWAATAIALPAQTFTTLVNFDGTNGVGPYFESLVQGIDGNLYGTTAYGGANGDGTVFKVSETGTLTTLHSFAGYPTDGQTPYGGLVQATNGNFYGTTTAGGTSGFGTVFEITPAGVVTTLHSFDYSDGDFPIGALIQATNGSLYGTTYGGGTGGNGTVFKITLGGALTTLYNFCPQAPCTDGQVPYAGLVQATNGSFYGTTSDGGANDDGTVFRITPAGELTILHSFDLTDGGDPDSALVQATNGSFYGTTTGGGANGYGTVFKITAGGTLTTLHSFDMTDGESPYAGLVQATNGNFYGTTGAGGSGADNFGTVFEITPADVLTTLHSFGIADGELPYGGLVQATNGTLYGTTSQGGDNSDGTIFSLSVGLGPFVETLPASGKVGSSVKILGTDLTGTTAVSFNGIAAKFTVKSATEIIAAVPTGATTGKVEVTTPSGTLTSNIPFRIP